MKPAKKKKWVPKMCEPYYLINWNLFEVYKWAFSNDYTDRKHIKNGNCFRTKAQAKSALDKVKRILRGAR
jgi:hypothetical protein